MCIGQKSASHTMSLVGGSNALGEPLPPFVVIASYFEPTIECLQSGPIAVVNGQRIGTTGTSNPKGAHWNLAARACTGTTDAQVCVPPRPWELTRRAAAAPARRRRVPLPAWHARGEAQGHSAGSCTSARARGPLRPKQ